jgi:hypothetical protein
MLLLFNQPGLQSASRGFVKQVQARDGLTLLPQGFVTVTLLLLQAGPAWAFLIS